MKRRRSSLLPLLIAVTVPVVVASVASDGVARDAAKKCTWRKALDVPGALFEGVAVAGGTVWAVGHTGDRLAYPLVSRWDGKKWSTTVSPVRGKHDQVIARTASQVWISGRQNARLALHTFDGRGWKTEFRPVDFANSANPRDVWMNEGQQLIRLRVDGSESRLTVPASMSGFWGRFAVDSRGAVWIDDDNRFYRWRGQRWVPFTHARSSSGAGVMAASTPDDVWAVGNSIEHWDGSSWKLLRHGGPDQVMHDVDALPGKALVVGQDWGRENAHGVIAEWSGTSWRHTTYLGARSSSNPPDCPACDISTVERVTGVEFATAREVWAVGWGGAGEEQVGVVFRGSCSW